MIQEKIKTRAPRNRTITLSDHDRSRLSARVLKLSDSVSIEVARNRIVHQDMLQATAHLPKARLTCCFLTRRIIHKVFQWIDVQEAIYRRLFHLARSVASELNPF